MLSRASSNCSSRGITTSPIKSPKLVGGKSKSKSKVKSKAMESQLSIDSPIESDEEGQGVNFFERYQTLMKQKQISHYSKLDKSVLLVVKDDSVITGKKSSPGKKRRGSAPSIQSPGGSMRSPGSAGLGSPGLKSPKSSAMRSSRATGPATFRSPDGQVRPVFSREGSSRKLSSSKAKYTKEASDSVGGLFINTEVLSLGAGAGSPTKGKSGGAGASCKRSPASRSADTLSPDTKSTSKGKANRLALDSPIPKRPSKRQQQLDVLGAIGGHGEVAQLSPRSKYLNACIEENVFPRQALMKRVTETSINIQNQGLGDKMTSMFMECYRDSTTLESVTLTDNNLTDKGLGPAIRAIIEIPSLTYVNISENIMGPQAAEALLALLDTDHCPVRQLVLRKCALDDLHCQCFVAALLKESHFSHLLELNMSNNKLGSSEVVNASNQTTGEVIATWLSRPECILQSLDLSWNTIRSHTGVVLSNSLAANKSLKRLDLSYNGLGTEGGSALGAALIHNKTLKYLSVSNNNLDSVATFTICAGIMENSALEEVVLDSNPIGEKGATALMMIPLIHFGRVKLSAKQCNLTIKDANCWFNFNKLPGKYLLKMGQPYDRAVALVLLRLVAFHHSCVFQKVEYDSTGLFLDASSLNGHVNGASSHGKPAVSAGGGAGAGAGRHTKEIPLAARYHNREHLFDDSQRRILTKMTRMIDGSADAIHAMKLFKEVDVDGSNGIDQHELELLMTSLGIHLSDYRLRETMATYDTDGNGSIDTEEFSCFLNHMRHEIEKHRHQLVSLPVLGLVEGAAEALARGLVSQRRQPAASALDVGSAIVHSVKFGNYDNEEGRYVPALTGHMCMEVVDSHTIKDVLYTVASCNRRYSDLVAQNTPDPEALKRATLGLTQIRVDDAVGICQGLVKKKKNMIHVLVNLLHQVSSVADARLLISEVIDGDRSKMVKLRREMGHGLKATLGMLNGYYSLDLSVPTDRKTLVSLYEQSRTLNHHKASKSPLGYGLLGDTSQKGNWSSFRNELYDGRPMVVDEEFIAGLPAYGTVEFDFSGEERFREGDVVTKDFAVANMLIHVGLIRAADLDSTMASLREMRLEGNVCSASNCGKTIYERSWADALEIARHSCAFYENLVTRPDYMDRAAILERCKFLATDSLHSTGESTSSTQSQSNSVSGQKRKNGCSDRGYVNETGTPQPKQKPFELNTSAKKTPQASHAPNSRLYDPEKVTTKSPEKRTGMVRSLSRTNSQHNSPVPARRTASSTNVTPIKSSLGHGLGSPAGSRRHVGTAMEKKLSGKHVAAVTVNAESINNNGAANSLLSPQASHGRTAGEVASFWKNHVLDNGHGLDDDGDEEYVLGGPDSLGLGSTGGFGVGGAPSEEYQDDTTKGDHFYGVIKAATSEEHAAYFVSIIKSEEVPDEVKMVKLLDIIEESFGCYKWINARHLALLLNCVECLPFGMVNRSKYFGNYRVDIVVMLFGHIVDRANFDLVLKELNPYETACVIARIGVLNFVNPMRPEGSHSLDLSLWDQRQLAKMYALLEVTEPGENWTNKQFRWIIDQAPIPSWQLTKMWMTEEGMPARGIVDLTYYSGEGVGKGGCQSCIPYRKSLLFMSALDGGDLRPEDQNPNQNPFKDSKKSSVNSDDALAVLQQNIEVWRDYIARDLKSANIQIRPVTAPRRIRKAIGFSPSDKGTRPFSNAMDITPTQSPSATLDAGGIGMSMGTADKRLVQSSSKGLHKSRTKLSISGLKRSDGVRAAVASSSPLKSMQSASLAQLQSPPRDQSTVKASTKARAGTGTGTARGKTVSTMKPNTAPRSASTPRTRPVSTPKPAGTKSGTGTGKGTGKGTGTSSSKATKRNSLGSKTERLVGRGSKVLDTIMSPGVAAAGNDGGGDSDSDDIPPPPRNNEANTKLRASASSKSSSSSTGGQQKRATSATKGVGGTINRPSSGSKSPHSSLSSSKYAHK